MIYLSSFLPSQEKVKGPYIYPYNVFARRDSIPLVFDRITVLYGNNASGKSTMLNIIAEVLKLYGAEKVSPWNLYFDQFCRECRFSYGEDEAGRMWERVPLRSRYIKSEDILYEIKKIQSAAVLEEDYIYEHVRNGMTKKDAEKLKAAENWKERMEIMQYAQEKYSNGETALQLFDDWMEPDALYLMDEPEVSLSPQNQIALAEKINRMARFLNDQFIIATHSPFMLGTLMAKIYDLDTEGMDVKKWTELENVRFMYQFFNKRRTEFSDK